MSVTSPNGSGPYRTEEAEALPSFADYIAVLRRRYRLVLACAMVGGLLGLAVLVLPPKSYTATTSVLAGEVPGDVAPGAGRGTLNMENQIELANSSAVNDESAARLGVDSDEVKQASEAEVATESSNVLVVSYTASDKEAARTGSKTVAEQYLDLRKQIGLENLDAQLASLRSELAKLETELEQLTTIQATTVDRTELVRAQLRGNQVSDQIAALQAEITRETVAVQPGRIIAGPSDPKGKGLTGKLLPIILGGMAGLFVGIFLAFLRDRLDGRLKALDDLRSLPLPQVGIVERLVVPELHSGDGAPPPGAAHADRGRRPGPPGVHARRPHEPPPGADLCGGDPARAAPGACPARSSVPSGSRWHPGAGGSRSSPATSAAMSSSSRSTWPMRSGSTTTASTRSPFSDVSHRVPGRAGLHVVPNGSGETQPLATLQSSEFSTLLVAAVQQSNYVLLDGPSLDVGADALVLAGVADMVVLAVTPDTEVEAVEAACAQLAMLDAVVAGFVMVRRGPSKASRRHGRSRRPTAPVPDAVPT